VDSQSCSGPTGTGDNPPGGFKSLAYVVSLRFFQPNCLLGLGLVRGLQAWATQDTLRAEELGSELCSRAGRPVVPSLAFAQGGLDLCFLLRRKVSIKDKLAARFSRTGMPRKPTLIEREILRFTYNYRSLDDVLQFANVTRPGIRLQQLPQKAVGVWKALACGLGYWE
jgi:hypothetical protein